MRAQGTEAPNYSPVGRRPEIAAQAVSAAPWASFFRSTYDSWGCGALDLLSKSTRPPASPPGPLRLS